MILERSVEIATGSCGNLNYFYSIKISPLLLMQLKTAWNFYEMSYMIDVQNVYIGGRRTSTLMVT